MSAFSEHREELERYEQMFGLERGRLAVSLDRLTNALVLVGQHGVYCTSNRNPMVPAMDLRMISTELTHAKELLQSVMEELRKKQAKSIEWAKEVGIVQVITATLGGGKDPNMDQVKKAADEYNKIAAISAKAGLQQGLHNEGFEVAMVDGKRVYDMLFDLLDPKLVKFQFQMSTITAGFVAADYFTKYPGRFYSMHLQDVDMKQGNPDQPGARVLQVAMGEGSIDWKKTFTAAKSGGVKNYFVEQNWELTQKSVAYLKTLNV